MAISLKYKVIIVIFIIIALLYAGQYFITHMNSTTQKKETFVDDDDVEHYEEPPVVAAKGTGAPPAAATDVKYDLRILVLDDIEKMHIIDKEVKGKLMQDIFAHDMDTLKDMNADERAKFIKNKYDHMKVTVSAATSIATAESIVKAEAPVPKTPKDTFEEPSKLLLAKAEDAIRDLERVQHGLKDIETYAKAISMSVPVSTQDTPAPVVAAAKIVPSMPAVQTVQTVQTTVPAVKTADPLPAPSISAAVTKPDITNTIEGFENIMSYAAF